MCQTTIVTSPVGPVAGRFALGLGAVAGLGVAAQMMPSVVLWLTGALGVTLAWAAIATIMLVRRRADTARPVAPVPQPAPQRAPVRVLAERSTTAALPAGVQGVGDVAARTPIYDREA